MYSLRYSQKNWCRVGRRKFRTGPIHGLGGSPSDPAGRMTAAPQRQKSCTGCFGEILPQQHCPDVPPNEDHCIVIKIICTISSQRIDEEVVMPATDQERSECARLLSDLYREMYRNHGSGLRAAIVHLAWVGRYEHRPWDVSALAAHLGAPRQTVSRNVASLARAGLLFRERHGRVVWVHPTDDGFVLERQVLDRELELVRTRAARLFQ